MELWKKVRIPLDKAREYMQARLRGEEPSIEAEAGGEGEEHRLHYFKQLPWKKILVTLLIVVGAVGFTIAAATIISNILTVGTVSLQPGTKVTASLVAGLPSSMKIYDNETFKFKLTNNDEVAHTVNIWGNVSVVSEASGNVIDSGDFELACNGTSATNPEDSDKYVVVHMPRSDVIDSGKTVLYVCWIKFTDEGLADKQVKVQVAAEELS